jgi:hypothetical protein
MDGSIRLPGGFSIGLDPIIGLIPGVGDLIGTAVSSAIVLQAQRAGIPKATLMRMIANVGIDAVLASPSKPTPEIWSSTAAPGREVATRGVTPDFSSS